MFKRLSNKQWYIQDRLSESMMNQLKYIVDNLDRNSKKMGVHLAGQIEDEYSIVYPTDIWYYIKKLIVSNQENINSFESKPKDYNNFELRKAIGERNVVKVNLIINYFAQNQKANPMVVTISLLNSFFTQLLIYHSLSDKSKNSVARALRINPFFAGDYTVAGRNYPMRKVSQIIGLLREADVKSKGVGANSLPPGDLLKELMFKIIH